MNNQFYIRDFEQEFFDNGANPEFVLKVSALFMSKGFRASVVIKMTEDEIADLRHLEDKIRTRLYTEIESTETQIPSEIL
jgi:hypothetical protein